METKDKDFSENTEEKALTNEPDVKEEEKKEEKPKENFFKGLIQKFKNLSPKTKNSPLPAKPAGTAKSGS